MRKNKLTLKQREFATTYIKTKNGTAAAMKAYEVKNKATARSISTANLLKPHVINFIEKALSDAKYNPVRTIEHLKATEEKGYQAKATVKDALHASEILLDLAQMTVKKTQNTNLNMNIDAMDMVDLLALKKRYETLLEK